MKTGIYFLLDKRKVVYVGRTVTWPVRLAAHRWMDFTSARVIECDPEDLVKNEARLIELFKPKYNIAGKSPNKPFVRHLTDDWIKENSQIIEKSLAYGQTDYLVDKMRSELGYSRTTHNYIILNSLQSRLERIEKESSADLLREIFVNGLT